MNVVRLYPQLYFCGTHSTGGTCEEAFITHPRRKNRALGSKTTQHKQSSGQKVSLGLPLQPQGTDGQACAAGRGRERLKHEANPRFRSITANAGIEVVEDSQRVNEWRLQITLSTLLEKHLLLALKKSYLKGPDREHGDNRVQQGTPHGSGIKHPCSSPRLDLSLAVESGAAAICRATATHHPG